MRLRASTRRGSRRSDDVRIRLPGRHNVLNALATIAVALRTRRAVRGPPRTRWRDSSVSRGASNAKGRGGRRISRLSMTTATIPREDSRDARVGERSSIAARVVVAFQPHRYTRTRDLCGRISSPRSTTRIFWSMTEIYAAGEEKIPGMRIGTDSWRAIRAHGHRDARITCGDLDAVARARFSKRLAAGRSRAHARARETSPALGNRLVQRFAARNTRDSRIRHVKHSRRRLGDRVRFDFSLVAAAPRCGSADPWMHSRHPRTGES